MRTADTPAAVGGFSLRTPLAPLPDDTYHQVPHPESGETMTQLIQRYLGTGDALARLKDHAGRLMRLQTVLEQHLPPALVSACSVANFKGDTLVLLANGGAVAARLKQIAPTLVQQFLAAGLPIQTIQVKVKVIEEHETVRPPTQRTLSAASSRSLADFSSTLPPESPLRESLERLINRSRRD
jgi:hypothetical protein